MPGNVPCPDSSSRPTAVDSAALMSSSAGVATVVILDEQVEQPAGGHEGAPALRRGADRAQIAVAPSVIRMGGALGSGAAQHGHIPVRTG